MRTLVALVAVLSIMTGWPDAKAGEARITSFVFGCETPDGRKLKPKFGDIDEAFYTDLPAQRQQCLEAIDRKIALCRENTSFESNTKDEKYAGCLPVFQKQAEVCVAHFERERVKCGAGAPEPAGAATLDSSERQQVQAVVGEHLFHSGCRYEGEWRDNDPNGHGTCTWPNGDRYEGEFRDGKIHGRGTYTWTNGDSKTCEWRDNESVSGTCEYH